MTQEFWFLGGRPNVVVFVPDVTVLVSCSDEGLGPGTPTSGSAWAWFHSEPTR